MAFRMNITPDDLLKLGFTIDPNFKAPPMFSSERSNEFNRPIDIQGFSSEGKLVDICVWSRVGVPTFFLSELRAWLIENTDLADGTYQIGFHDILDRRRDGGGVAGQE